MAQLLAITYAALRKKVEETLLLGRQKIEEAKVLTYWETGRLINQYLGKTPDKRQERHQQVVARLAKDLELGEKVFYRCMRFAESFPYFSARRNMTWAHYRALIAVPDEKTRLALAEQAAKAGWTSRDLEIEIRNLLWNKRLEISDGQPPRLPFVCLGPFYTWMIIRPETLHSRSRELLLDLGFSSSRELNTVTNLKGEAGDIVQGIRGTAGKWTLIPVRSSAYGESRAQDPVPRTPDDILYTYKAFVQKVIDGDTLKVEFDIGFGDWRGETIRLNHIDCPEMDTPQGQAAKRFVERELSGCEFITVKSVKTRREKWGRYLGDVFYEKKGRPGLAYLNQLLLAKGHAVRVRS